MRVINCDVLVVGSGPAGSSAARAAAQAGVCVVVAERRHIVGRPVRCAEYIPAMLVGQADVGDEYIVQRTTGMRSFLHGRCIQDMVAPGCVIDREMFDQALARAAVCSGARILPGHAAVGREGGAGSRVLLSAPNNATIGVAARVVIGADGPVSRVARWVGLPRPHCLPSIQVRLPLQEKLEHTHIYFDESIRAGYAWVFPKGNVANVGLGMLPTPGTPGLRWALRRFVRGMVGLGLVGDRPLGLTGGWIPAGPPRSYVYGDTILAGDAAGHTHPITGAGIFQAVVGGAMAGRWAARAVLEDDLSLLRKYEEEWADFYGDALSHAHQRRQLWEAHTGSLDAAIKKFWIGFREYYAAS